MTATSAPARNTKVMNRFDLTSRLVGKLKNEEAVIGGIGNTNFDLWAAGHRPQNFYMLGSMGLAFPIALGVALAQPKRRVFALEGDGSLLMQVGSLSTIATLAPKNLTMVVMDNGIYQITGAQPTPAATVSDLVAIATLGPAFMRPHSNLGQDGEHALAFVLVGIAFGLAYPRHRMFTMAMSVVAIGVLELLQLWAPGRHARLEDFVVDALTACVGF